MSGGKDADRSGAKSNRHDEWIGSDEEIWGKGEDIERNGMSLGVVGSREPMGVNKLAEITCEILIHFYDRKGSIDR